MENELIYFEIGKLPANLRIKLVHIQRYKVCFIILRRKKRTN
jgi:hypothetical protein